MKKIFRTLMIVSLIALGLASCKNREQEAVETADLFIHAYYQAEFEQAAEYCDDEFKEKILSSTKLFANLNDKLKAKVQEINKNAELEKIGQSQVNDTCFLFQYKFTRKDIEHVVKSNLTMVYKDGAWKVKNLKNDSPNKKLTR